MDAILEVIVERLVRGYDPDRVILYGSRATGRAGPSSDVDLLVIKETTDRPVDRRVKAHALLTGVGVPIDVQVYTPAELRALYYMGSPLVEEAMETGKVLYMRKVTAAWLQDAADDHDTARLLLDHGRYRGALLHSQQAAEKALKAIILERGVRPPHTHNLAELVTQVAQVGVAPGLDMDTAVYLTNVYRSRYPNEDGLLPHGDPTEEDARRAVTGAAAVLDAARRALDVPSVTG